MSPNYSGKNILCLSYFAIFCTVRGHQHRARRRRAAFSLGQPGNDHPGSFCDGLPSKSRLIILPASLTSLEVRKWSLFTFSISAYVCYVQTLATPLCPPTTRLPITRKCAVTAVCVWVAVRHDPGTSSRGRLPSDLPWEGVPRSRGGTWEGRERSWECPWVIMGGCCVNRTNRRAYNECTQSRSCHCLCENKHIMPQFNVLD